MVADVSPAGLQIRCAEKPSAAFDSNRHVARCFRSPGIALQLRNRNDQRQNLLVDLAAEAQSYAFVVGAAHCFRN